MRKMVDHSTHPHINGTCNGRCEWCNTIECEIVYAPEGRICEMCSENYGYGEDMWKEIRAFEYNSEYVDRD